MKLLIVLATAILVVQSIDIDEQWQKFKVTQHKLYKSLVEDKVRYNIFKDNVNTIEEHNKRYEEGLESYKMGINQFTDMTQEEFMNLLKTSGNKPKIPEVIEKVLIEDHPKSVRGVQVDWRKKGAVTGVKNQGQCGSCWSFSTIGSLEGAYFFKHKKLLSFSEQCLVDCSTANHGCSGGWMTTAFNYIFQHGITTENKYPYKAKQGKCSYHDNQSVTKISKIGVIKKNSEPVLQYATAKYGPISVAIDASKFQHYSSGIINDKSCSSTKLNHGVLVVGYGNENGLDYWIVKNSWGNNWGEKGYVRMARNKNNQCGIAAAACFPFL